MHLCFLHLNYDQSLKTPGAYWNEPGDHLRLYSEIHKVLGYQISVVHRACFTKMLTEENVSYLFITDEHPPSLGWWQEPATSLEKLAKLKPDIVQIVGLNLPLQFRWLRRVIGEEIKIIGQHTGEVFWANRNIWLQQFGLRVADAFFFAQKRDYDNWLKASVVLSRQKHIILDLNPGNLSQLSDSLDGFYAD